MAGFISILWSQPGQQCSSEMHALTSHWQDRHFHLHTLPSNHSPRGCRLQRNAISKWKIKNDGKSIFLTQVKSGFVMLLLKRHLLAYLDWNVQMYTLCQENTSVKLSWRKVGFGELALKCLGNRLQPDLQDGGRASLLFDFCRGGGGSDSPTLEALLLCLWKKKIWKGRWSNLRVAYLRLALRFWFYASRLALSPVLFVYVEHTG